jgi:hypothetical protein
MTAPENERHKRWKEKQVAAGKKSITIMVDDWLKEMIDDERKRTNSTTARVLTKCVLNFVDPKASDSIVEVPVEEMQEIANDLLGVVKRIEKIARIKATVASDNT